MTEQYYTELFETFDIPEKEGLLIFLVSPSTEDIRNSTEKSALMIESPRWKITFYSKQDIESAIRLLKNQLITA